MHDKYIAVTHLKTWSDIRGTYSGKMIPTNVYPLLQKIYDGYVDLGTIKDALTRNNLYAKQDQRTNYFGHVLRTLRKGGDPLETFVVSQFVTKDNGDYKFIDALA